MENFKDTFRCLLKVISPIHLGCDEVYEPFGFVIDESNGTMTVFDSVTFIESLAEEDRSKFSEICKKGNVESLLEIYKFYRGRKVEGRCVNLSSAFVSHYQKILSLKANNREVLKNLNQFQILRTAFRPYDDRPYIPGTAVKGAIRTAYLNEQAKSMKIPKHSGKHAHIELQEKLMGYNARHLESDPFRLVKVSDFRPVGEIKARIVYAINKKKRISDREARGPYQILEVIEPGSVFTGTITVDRPNLIGNRQFTVDLDKLMNSIGNFYATENRRECDELKRIGIDGVIARKDGESFPLRIGRHSGAESITIDGHRSIKILKGKKEYDFQNKATTVWLASETETSVYNKRLAPFGWIQLQSLTKTIEQELKSKEEDYSYQMAQAEKIRFEEISMRRIAAEAEQTKTERIRIEKERQAKEEQELRKARESMSTEDRLLADLDEKNVSEEQVNIAFKTIDDFTYEKRPLLARKLKAYWIAQKSWTKKDVGNKKWKTVRARNQKIDEILGE